MSFNFDKGGFLKIFFVLGIIACFSWEVLAEVTGTYSWVGVGCRDSSLSESSHVPKLPSDNLVEISSAVLILNNDGSTLMRTVQRGKVTENSGRYERRDNFLFFYNPGEDEAIFQLTVVEDKLIDVETNKSESRRICGEDKVYVYVLART